MSGSHGVALRIAPDHPALPGHFPGHPLVPGVVVLERVAAAWKAWCGTAVAGLDAKFVQSLLPGEAATIMLHDADGRARFEVTRGDGRVLARGTLVPAGLRDGRGKGEDA